MMVMVMMVIVATAAFAVFMMMFVIVVVMMLMLMFMVMIVAAAFTIFMMMLVIVVVMMFMFMFMLMIVVMVVTAAAFFILMMVMLMLNLSSKRIQFSLKGRLLFHNLQNLFTSQLIPGSGDDRSLRIMFTQQRNGSFQLVLFNVLSTGQDNRRSMLDLVVIKFAEVFHVHFDLARIGNGGESTQYSTCGICRLNSTDNVRQLADTRRFNQNTVRMVLFNHLMQCGCKIANQAAADTTGVHLIDLNAGILQKSPVNSDFAKLVFDQYQLFTLIAFCNQLFNQSCFTGTQKTGENINFGHETRLPFYLTKKYGLQWKIAGQKSHIPYYNPYL